MILFNLFFKWRSLRPPKLPFPSSLGTYIDIYLGNIIWHAIIINYNGSNKMSYNIGYSSFSLLSIGHRHSINNYKKYIKFNYTHFSEIRIYLKKIKDRWTEHTM